MFPAMSRRALSLPLLADLRAAIRPRRWLLFVLAVPLGIVLSIALQTRPIPASNYDTSIRAVSAGTILRLEDEQRSLKDTIKTLRDQVVVAQREEAARRTQLSGLSNEIETLKQGAGLTDMRGSGVRVTLDDSQSRAIPIGTDPNLLLIHDYDLRDVAALLWSNGAEAVDINGQRLVATTSIYCVGSTILVNDTRLSPPYVIQAIGPNEMQAAIESPTALAQFKSLARQYGLGFNTAPANDLKVPAFDGRLSTRYSSPMEQ